MNNKNNKYIVIMIQLLLTRFYCFREKNNESKVDNPYNNGEVELAHIF